MKVKQLKFSDHLPELILAKVKDITWRINDSKWISCGDKLSLCYNNWKEFAKWEVLWTKETSFKNLTNEDVEWNWKFNSDKEMFETFSKYYNIEVWPNTKLKVIKFKIW